jgi:hypothetical protein
VEIITATKAREISDSLNEGLAKWVNEKIIREAKLNQDHCNIFDQELVEFGISNILETSEKIKKYFTNLGYNVNISSDRIVISW